MPLAQMVLTFSRRVLVRMSKLFGMLNLENRFPTHLGSHLNQTQTSAQTLLAERQLRVIVSAHRQKKNWRILRSNGRRERQEKTQNFRYGIGIGIHVMKEKMEINRWIGICLLTKTAYLFLRAFQKPGS